MIITINAYWVILVGLIVLYLAVKASKKAYKETVYVDTSGIESNPPNFLETLENKTLNIKVDENNHISINHFNVATGLTRVKLISGLLKSLQILMDKSTGTLKDKATLYFVNGKLITELYKLIKPHATWRAKRAFIKRAYKDSFWTFKIVEEIYNYWMCVGKLLALLMEGQTLRMTTGGSAMLNSTRMDSDGVTYKPRALERTSKRSMKSTEKE